MPLGLQTQVDLSSLVSMLLEDLPQIVLQSHVSMMLYSADLVAADAVVQ